MINIYDMVELGLIIDRSVSTSFPLCSRMINKRQQLIRTL